MTAVRNMDPKTMLFTKEEENNVETDGCYDAQYDFCFKSSRKKKKKGAHASIGSS